MGAFVRKVIKVGKATIMCIFILFILLLAVKSPSLTKDKECFDLRSASLISIGGGATICLGINSRKKV